MSKTINRKSKNIFFFVGIRKESFLNMNRIFVYYSLRYHLISNKINSNLLKIIWRKNEQLCFRSIMKKKREKKYSIIMTLNM